MKAWIISLFLFMPVIIYGQNSILNTDEQEEIKYPDFYPTFSFEKNTYEINLTITDTVIIVKKNTNKNRYAAKVNVEVNIPDLQDTLLLYLFNQYVPTKWFESDTDPLNTYLYSIGLNFIVENTSNNIIQAQVQIIHGSYVRKNAETRIDNSRHFVTSKQIIKFKRLNKEEQRNYDLAKYEITNETQSLVLHPLIGSFHYLPEGEYYLYFVYSFTWNDRNMTQDEYADSRTFKGNFVSNKVKLIVE